MVGRIGSGLVILLGLGKQDTEETARALAEKIVHLRVFDDADGKMNISLLDSPGHDVLAVSNFTVFGDTKKSRRPSFTESAPFEHGKTLFESFVVQMRAQGFKVPTGVFGGDMAVTLVNDGPVTIIVDV